MTAHVNNHSGPVIFGAIKGMIQAAHKRNFDVLQIQADNERGIHSPLLEEYCADRKIKVLRVGSGQHEASAERVTRHLKAEVRNIGCRIIPSSLTNELLVQLILAATTSINARLTSALTGDLSPQQIWFGDPHIHAEDVAHAFGDLVLAKTPNQKNDVAPRADTAMILYPNFSGLHGYQVYKLGTGTIVTRNYNTLQPVHWTPTDIIHMERLGNRDPNGVYLPRQEQGHNQSTQPTDPTNTQAAENPTVVIQEPAQRPANAVELAVRSAESLPSHSVEERSGVPEELGVEAERSGVTSQLHRTGAAEQVATGEPDHEPHSRSRTAQSSRLATGRTATFLDSLKPPCGKTTD